MQCLILSVKCHMVQIHFSSYVSILLHLTRYCIYLNSIIKQSNRNLGPCMEIDLTLHT